KPRSGGAFSWAPPATERRRRGSEAPLRLLAQRQQRGVATGGGGIDGDRLLGSEPRQVVRPASLRTGTRKALAAKRLHADHRADLVAVDVAVADLDPRGDLLDRLVDARVHAARQPVAGRVDRVADLVELARLPADHVQPRAEHFPRELVERAQRVRARREETAVG